jgi:hypothetical protein
MRGDAAFFSDLAQSMEQVEAVGNVHANSVTGSILIEGSSLSVGQVRDLAGKRCWLDILPSPSASHEIESVGAAIERWRETRGRELMRLAPLAVLSLAAIQVTRGQLLPPAFSLFLYALDVSRARDVSVTRSVPLGS